MSKEIQTYVEQNIDLVDDNNFVRLYAGLIEAGLYYWYSEELLALYSQLNINISQEVIDRVQTIFDMLTPEQIIGTAEDTSGRHESVTDSIMYLLDNWHRYDWGAE